MIARIVGLMILTLGSKLAFSETTNLMDVYAVALEADPRVQIARGRLGVSEAQLDVSWGNLYPQISISANLSDNDVECKELGGSCTEGGYDGERYALSVRQTLFNWRSISNRDRMKELVSQRELELADVLSILLLDVSERYVQVLASEDELDLIAAERDFLHKQLQEAERMRERKRISITDLLDIQARADAVSSDLIDAEYALLIRREELYELTGQPVGDLSRFASEIDFPELQGSIESWVQRTMDQNPLLRSKHEGVQAARENISEQRGGHFPEIDLVYSDQISDIGFDNQQSPERETKYIGVEVRIPLYSGGKTSASVRGAYQEESIALAEMEAVRREVVRRCRAAFLELTSSRKRIHSTELQVASADKALEAMKRGFELGSVTSADVLEALQNVTRARRDQLSARYKFVLAYLGLKREAGELSQDDLLEVNGWLAVTAQ